MQSLSVYFYFLFLLLSVCRLSEECDLETENPPRVTEFSTRALLRNGIRLITSKRGLKSLSCTYPNIRRGKLHTSLYVTFIMISCSADVELNPGPRAPKFPCQICSKAVTSRQQGVACDDCNQWYHTKCMLMSTNIYDCLNNISWRFVTCGMPQFTSSFFESFDISSENSFSSLSLTCSTHVSSPGPPISSSSPISSHKKKNTPSFRTLKVLNINFQKYTKKSEVNSMWADIKEHLLDILEACVPSKMTSSRFSQPWINREVKRLSRRKKRSYRKARQTKNPVDQKRYKHMKKLSKDSCKKAYNDYMTNIISPDSSSNPKRFWGFIKSKKNESHGVFPLKAKTGITYSDSATKANLLNEQFSSVFNKDENTSDIPNLGPSPHPTVSSITVTNTGVHKLLAGLEPHKATGPDELPSRLLKELASELTPIYTLFFQASLDQGIIPTDWKEAKVVPIYKKGEQNKPENYRPVSLTSISCKTLEHIVSSSIMKHMDHHSILTDAQHGFRKRRSCETQLLVTIQDLASTIDKMGQTDIILLDFSKAFDKVPHQRLLSKLNYYGVRHSLHSWISSFLNDRTQEVTLDGITSDQAPVQSGVPQGSVLGPLLFLLYINDLPTYTQKNSTVRLFADDCVLYREIKSAADTHALQEDLDDLQRWEKDWLMEFHPHKCQVMHVTNKRSPIRCQYKIHEHTLEEVDSAKYLGLNIQKSLNWNQHINTITKKANNTRSFLQRNIHQCPAKTKELCYTTLIRPLVEYASIIWDPHTDTNIRKLEMVQRRSARMVLSDYRRTSSVSSMLQQLQWPTLQERRAQAKVTMMYRIVYHIVDVPSTHLIAISSIRGHGLSYLVPFARTICYQKSYFPDTIRIWNALPSAIVSCPTVDAFRRELQTLTMR